MRRSEMSMRAVVPLFLALFVSGSALRADEIQPAAALDAAKVHIGAKRYAEAVAVLEKAMDGTASLSDPSLQKQARTAVHFYLAVAYSGMGRDDDALSHLEEAFRLSPGMHAVDTRRYDARFVALFDRARSAVVGSGRFEELYPGFASTAAPAMSELSSTEPDPAIEFLASGDEKREWRNAVTPEQRARFTSTFWLTRDQTPGTEANEFRDTFARRVAFSDATFALPAQRGALTDRGRVFAILGPPALVRRRAINSGDAIQSISRGSVGIEAGTIEYWFYTREQLPVRIPQPTLTFRFVSHQGIGEFVLQRDGLAINAMASVVAAARK